MFNVHVPGKNFLKFSEKHLTLLCFIECNFCTVNPIFYVSAWKRFTRKVSEQYLPNFLPTFSSRLKFLNPVIHFVWIVRVWFYPLSGTGLMYFDFCRLYPPPPSHHGSVWLLPVLSLFLTNTVSPVRACLSIWLESCFVGAKWSSKGIQSSIFITICVQCTVLPNHAW